jgi:hypothetical protein
MFGLLTKLELAPRCPPTSFAPGGETIPFRLFGDHNGEAFFQNPKDSKLSRYVSMFFSKAKLSAPVYANGRFLCYASRVC